MNKEISAFLKHQGYKHEEVKDYGYPILESHLWYKGFPGYARCTCNNDKDIQVCIKYTLMGIFQEDPITFLEVEIVGETNNKHWHKIKTYSINDEDFIQEYEEVVLNLLKAWETLHGI